MARKTALDMTFAEVYPALIAKAERKGRSRVEVYACTTWLLGYNAADIDRMLEDGTSFREFLEQGVLCADAEKVTGSICGIKIDEIEDLTTKTMRRLDKLIDELAKGKSLEKILNRP